jgi:hypothetical protein
MLFPLFLLSLLQLLVLPGLLLHRLFGLRLRGPVGIAVLSLIGNYVLMHGLMVAPLLGTVHLPWIVAAEAVALGIAYRDRLRDTVRVPLLGLGLTLVGLALLAWLVSPDLPSVFTSNDAVRSWNRWALSWAADEAPQRTVMYPQLVPTLYVVVYLLTGDPTLQVLSKPVAIAFPGADPGDVRSAARTRPPHHGRGRDRRSAPAHVPPAQGLCERRCRRSGRRLWCW